MDSILCQKVSFHFEILIGEDFSSDGTRQVCIEYADRYSDKIRLFLRSDRIEGKVPEIVPGRENLLNVIKKSRGKYVARCDGDDYWIKDDKLAFQYDFFENNLGCNLMYTNCRIEGKSTNKSKFLNAGSYWFSFFDSIQRKQGPTVTFAFRKKSLDFDLYSSIVRKTVMADWPMEVLLSINGDGFRSENVTGVYLEHDYGLANTRLKDRESFYSSRLTLFQALHSEWDSNDQRGEVLRALRVRLYILRATYFLGKFSLVSAGTDLFKAIKLVTISINKNRTSIEWIDRFKTQNIIKESIQNLI